MITILGTSHVSKQSAREVKLAIAHADIVCLELDAGRLQALLSKKQATFNQMREVVGTKAAIMASVLRWLQQKVAKNVGVLPGVEMRAAFKEAAAQNKQIMLIDQEVSITMRRLAKSFGWREVWRMLLDIRPRKIPLHPSDDLVVQLMAEVKDRYPRIYKTLVAERDSHMSRALLHIQQQYPGKAVLAIVGKGHVQGILHHVNYLNQGSEAVPWSSPATSS